jgi:hypothetical protein
MEKWHRRCYHALLAIMLISHAGTVLAQSIDNPTVAGQYEMVTSTEETAAGCRIGARDQYVYSAEANGQRPATRGMLAAEDMRCRQCRGKCSADSLRCRSQCLEDSACLSRCEERTSKCEGMCKQVFQCD